MTEEHIDPKKRGKRRTVCEVLREIHRATDDPKIHALTDEAHVMAKKMARRLQEYAEGRA